MMFREFGLASIALVAFLIGEANAAPRWDANNDGRMQKDEFVTRATNRLMRRADTNKDGRISLEEWRARPAAAKAKNDPVRRFARLDANGDGALDAAEMRPVMERRFDRRDANRDGILAEDERRARPRTAN